MREQGQVEVVSIRRTWLGKTTGRRENFYRLARARSGAAIIEGAIAADEDPKTALAAYRRPWKSGGIDHAAHRSDLYLMLAEKSLVEDDVVVEPELMTSETHLDYPYYGAKTVPLDSGGEKLRLKKTARRKYEEVTPDGEFFGEFRFARGEKEVVLDCPYLLELERRTNARAVEEKIQKCAGYWLRRLETFGEVLIRPVVIVHHDTRPARTRGRREGTGAFSMRHTLNQRLSQSGHYRKLAELLQSRHGLPINALGRFFLLADWEPMYDASDPFGLRYHPIGQYPAKGSGSHVSEDCWTVDLAAAAIERTRLLATLGVEEATA